MVVAGLLVVLVADVEVVGTLAFVEDEDLGLLVVVMLLILDVEDVALMLLVVGLMLEDVVALVDEDEALDEQLPNCDWLQSKSV